jgi:hypothetical protein
MRSSMLGASTLEGPIDAETREAINQVVRQGDINALSAAVASVQIAEALVTNVSDPITGDFARDERTGEVIGEAKLETSLRQLRAYNETLRESLSFLPDFAYDWVDFLSPQIKKLQDGVVEIRKSLPEMRRFRSLAIDGIADLGYSISMNSFGEREPGQITEVTYYPKALYSSPMQVPRNRQIRVNTAGLTGRQLIDAAKLVESDLGAMSQGDVRGLGGAFAAFLVALQPWLVLLAIVIWIVTMIYNHFATKEAIEKNNQAADTVIAHYGPDSIEAESLEMMVEFMNDYKVWKKTATNIGKAILIVGGGAILYEILRKSLKGS